MCVCIGLRGVSPVVNDQRSKGVISCHDPQMTSPDVRGQGEFKSLNKSRYSSRDTEQCTLYTVYCTVYTVHPINRDGRYCCWMYLPSRFSDFDLDSDSDKSPRGSVQRDRPTLYTVQCSTYSVQCILHIVHPVISDIYDYLLYDVNSSMYNIRYTMHSSRQRDYWLVSSF